MFKNYLKIAFRNIIRHKAFAAINVAGLAIGMACSIFIFLWVQNELSYDRFHTNASSLYRITADASDFKVAINPAAMPAGLKADLPVIKDWVRLQRTKYVFEIGEKRFEEKNGFFADSNFLQVFSFPLLKGNIKTALHQPDAVLLTEDLAKKYFADSDPIGKTLKINNDRSAVVTGVLQNLPSNSHLQFDYLMPMSFIAKTNRDIVNNLWDNFNFYSYLLLDGSFVANAANLKALEKQIDAVYKKHVSTDILKVDFQLQPLDKIHLHSTQLQGDVTGHGNYLYVKIFFVVAVFILLVACINFMNLATARSARRAKEVGLRKVVGAGRKQLILQFLGESVLVSFASLVIALLLVWLLLPVFNQLAGKSLAIKLYDGNLLLTLTGIAFATGLIAGSYPALFLSGFQPVKVLKGNLRSTGGNLIFRNTLVVTQFVVSIVLLAGTAIVYKQLSYIKNMSLGYDKSNLIYIPMSGDIWNKKDAYKASLKQNPLTAQYAFTDDMPSNLTSGTVNVQWDGKDPNSQVVIPTLHVNEDFVDVFQLKLLGGRSFSRDFKADTANYMINEKAAKLMGLTAETAIGKQITMWDKKGMIVGVVQDFNFKPVQHAIEPLIMPLNTWGGITVIRTQPGQTEATLKALEKINATLNPAFPFSFGFLDEDLERLYKGEQQMSSLFNIFAILGIFISCMGLYGLSAFMAEQRTKEIGVRKVLGASVFNVVYLLSTNFTRLVLIAIVIAIPIAWYVFDSWLQGFAYRVAADWVVFLSAAIAALLIAWLTVSYESIKAALMNPIRSLRTE